MATNLKLTMQDEEFALDNWENEGGACLGNYEITSSKESSVKSVTAISGSQSVVVKEELITTLLNHPRQSENALTHLGQRPKLKFTGDGNIPPNQIGIAKPQAGGEPRNSVITYRFPDRPGLASFLDALPSQFQVEQHAAQGYTCPWDKHHVRRGLVSGEIKNLLQLHCWVQENASWIESHLHILPKETWTISACSPVVDGVIESMSAACWKSGVNIVWDTRLQTNAFESIETQLPQYLVVTAKGSSAVASLDTRVRDWAIEFTGSAVVLPGIVIMAE